MPRAANKLSVDLILSMTELDMDTKCWNWRGSRQTCGYGQIRMGGKNCTAHRLSWIAHRGPLPYGMHVLHHCDNPSCCNPEHLYVGTHTDNMRDMIRRNRCGPRKRESSRIRKLTNEQVIRIRRSGESAKTLAAELGITRQTVYRVRNGTRKLLVA